MTTRTPQVRKIACGNLLWHVQIAGQGPLCLLVHGTGASVHTWRNLAPLLPRHFTLVMMDLPGHAQTRTPAQEPLTLPAMADALWRLLEQEQWHAQVMVGHSAGAAIMLELCLKHPEYARRLVSINGAVIPLQGLAGWVFSPLARLSANSQLMARFFAFRAQNDRNIKKLLDSTGSTVDATSFRSYADLFSDPQHVSGVLRMMANWQLDALNAQLHQLQQTVHLVAAANDKTIPVRDTHRLQQLLPPEKVSTHVLPARGHLVHEEDPESVAGQILAFACKDQTMHSPTLSTDTPMQGIVP